LVQRAGFGLTLPLHAELAIVAGQAVQDGCPEAWYVNGCFPDAVNPVLACLGLPVLCGIGNIAIIAAGLQTALGVADHGRLAVLAHHVHLHAPEAAPDEALAWLDGAPVAEVGKLLAAARRVARPELNQVTGLTAALLLRDLLAGDEVDAHVPGPLGLPGGYPVRVSPLGVTLRLPVGVSEDDAITANQRWAALDGVVVGDNRILFAPRVAAEVGSAWSRLGGADLSAGFAARDVIEVARLLHRLRAELRAEPRASPPPAASP
jgi:hypothetical protein